MNAVLRLADAIDHMDDKFLEEAVHYKKRNTRYGAIGILAAGICIMVSVLWGIRLSGSSTLQVYAYETKQAFSGEISVLPGRIDDDGRMQGPPLKFYVLGKNIETIRFSCKNEWISFMDWTEQRENYGLSRNFTVAYGEKEEEYSYLVIDWVPQNIIRKLTDNRDVTLSKLTPEEKEDKIVLEVSYLDGSKETFLIRIHLKDDGYFAVSSQEYTITEEDAFVFNRDGKLAPEPIPEVERESGKNNPSAPGDERTKESETARITELSPEELERVTAVIEAYYAGRQFQIEELAQVNYETSFFREYEGYDPAEVVLFELRIEGMESKRYISIGSKDGWQECSVLNEGF